MMMMMVQFSAPPQIFAGKVSDGTTMAGEGDLKVSRDKLLIKRLDCIEESGVEHFHAEIGYEEKTVNLIRRIDFAWAVERDVKKTKEAVGPSTLQGLVENLQLAHQELSVIIDLINTVEANDAVAVAGMNRPKPLPNEVLSDLSVSTATKLQSYRHLSKYFKQSAKSLEQQIAREARFYGALIRLQQNWKIKRHRLAASAPGSEGFLIDLSDNSMYGQSATTRLPAFTMVRVDHDSSGMLAVKMPKNSRRSLHFGFLDIHLDDKLDESDKINPHSAEESLRETKKSSLSDDEHIRETHTVLCDAHRAIFYEQVFELVSRESANPSLGISVTGIRENYLELSIKPGLSVFLSFEPSELEDQRVKSKDTQTVEDISSNGENLEEKKQNAKMKFGYPNHRTYEVYLQQLYHDDIFGNLKDKPTLPGRTQSNQQGKDAAGIMSHFCLSLAHRIFSNKVLKELENLVIKSPYFQLFTQPTWHSRTSSWTLSVKIPESILNGLSQACRSDDHQLNISKSLFQAKVLVKDDCISIEGAGAPKAVSLIKSNPQVICSKNRFNCDLVDLPMALLLQVASKIIDWLHEEAQTVGIKTRRDFLSLSLEIVQGDILNLVAHVDPDDPLGCISWWLTLEDGFTREPKLFDDVGDDESSGTRRFLGYLSLDELYSTLMDLVSLCSGCVNH